MADSKKKTAGTSEKRSLVRRLTQWISITIVVFAVVWVGIFVAFAPELPDTAELWRVKKSPGITLLAADGAVLARRGGFGGTLVGVDRMPAYLPQAVIATEDRRFYRHFGMDVVGFARALYSNIRAGGVVQGGSTLTQQLAKNLYLSSERTLMRKIRELILAIWLETRLSKDQILTLYLNRVYLGAGAYGVEAASQRYFGKPATQVDLSEAALLAGLLKAPTRYAPTSNLKLSRERAGQVLANMVDAGYLSPAQADAARRRPARLATLSGTLGTQYFIDWVMGQLPEFTDGLYDDVIVRTTLDTGLQKLAEQALAAALERDGRRLKVSQGALVALDPTGAVKAMVGGRSYAQSQFNRAVQARRQPGSAFKPFVYLAALETGYTPGSVVRDAPVSFDGWKPRNFSGTYRGDVTLERALADSINTVAVSLSENVGRDKVIALVHRLGVASPMTTHPSLALGTSEVTLLEMTGAFAPFANSGFAVAPDAILDIRTRDGRTVHRRSTGAAGRVVRPRHVDQMNQMMAEVMATGTGRAARLGRRPAAGKTGTSQKFRDGWFIGYTADLVTGVWLGNDDDTPMVNVTGGNLPARVWHDFMYRALAARPARALPSGYATASRDEPAAARPGAGLDVTAVVDRVFRWFSEATGIRGLDTLRDIIVEQPDP